MFQRALFFCCFLFFASACSIHGYGARRGEPALPVFHTIRAGDTISGLAAEFGVSAETIALFNGIRDPKRLLVGMRLVVSYAPPGTNPAGVRVPLRSQATPLGVPIPLGGQLAWPTVGGRLVSGFGPRKKSFHDGIDIAAKSGTPVFAAHSAKVMYSGSGLRGYGKLLILKDRDGLVTVYAHNRRLLVKKGKNVSRGDKIAEVGSTGRSSGPHLHFEVRGLDRKGRYIAIDPLPYLGKKSDKPPRYRVNESLTALLKRKS